MAEKRRGGDGKREGESSSAKNAGKTRQNPSLVSLAMARTASKPAGVSSMDAKKLMKGLYEGVLLDDDKVKFWIDEKLHENCLMVLAKGLNISDGENRQHWSWTPYQEKCFGGLVDTHEARLNSVGWLDISGKLPCDMLSPMTTYEVVIVLKMTKDASGWDVPVDLGLNLPNGTTQIRSENLGKKPKEGWFEIPLGKFVATPETAGNIGFFLTQHSSGHMKKGLVVKGVVFRPKC